MQNHSFLTDLIQFKDEIFKQIRLLENRLTSDITDKFTQSNIMYESVNNRLGLLSSNNDSLLELLTSQKLNLDKIDVLEKFMNQIEQSVLRNEIKIKKIFSDMEYLSLRCDRIISDNLQVVGHIGPGCQYKNISEYIRQNISEFNKMKSDKEKMKVDITSSKSKVENIVKNISSLVDNAIFSCQKYSDKKYIDVKNILEKQKLENDEKNMDLRALLNKTETDNQKNVENIMEEIDKLQNMKNELIISTDDKIKEINDKIDSIIEEIVELKKMKNENNKMNNKKSIGGMNINSKIYINSNENRISIENINNKDSQQKNNSKEKVDYNNIINTNETIKENKIKEINLIKINNIKEKNIESINPKNEINEEKKDNKNNIIKEKIIINEKDNDKKIETNKINNTKKEQKIEIEISEKTQNKEKEESLDINKKLILEKKNNNIDIKNIIEKEKSKIFSQPIKQDIKEQRIMFKKINSIFPTKALEIQEKNENKKNKEISELNFSGSVENRLHKNIEENNSDIMQSMKNNLNNTKESNLKMNKTILSDNENNALPILKRLMNKKVVNKMTILSPKKSLDFIQNNVTDKKKFEKKIYKSEEQKNIMNYIKIHYNNIKGKQEQKSQDNMVNCNIINLRLDNKNKRKQNNFSAKKNINKNRNSLGEFGMKLSPAFGRTNYNFYIKNKIGESFDDAKNGYPYKMSGLKTSLNAAFVTTIKNKIFFNDKGKNNIS